VEVSYTEFKQNLCNLMGWKEMAIYGPMKTKLFLRISVAENQNHQTSSELSIFTTVDTTMSYKNILI
jgi:hypothetical protein